MCKADMQDDSYFTGEMLIIGSSCQNLSLLIVQASGKPNSHMQGFLRAIWIHCSMRRVRYGHSAAS